MTVANRRPHRLSAKVEFSPEAERLYLAAKNKSEFIRSAIEHYAHHYAPFKADIEEIKRLLLEIKEAGIAVSTALPSQETATAEEAELTDEERAQQDLIQHTLSSFLNFGGGGDG